MIWDADDRYAFQIPDFGTDSMLERSIHVPETASQSVEPG